jgi:sortase A
MKKNFTNIILILVFITGLSLLLYPTVSDYWNSLHQSQAVARYVESVAQLDDNEYEKMWQAAERYNGKLSEGLGRFIFSEEDEKEYEALLDVAGNGIMSYIEIPSISCTLPIYHGIDEAVLQIAVGHIGGSSLPVGGESTHCVLSGHRGLPSAKLFSALDQLKEGDIFMLRTLDEILTYEVDQIRIVLPHEVDELEFIEGEDLCTLVTCTPYGVNSHRLLVRGKRIENLTDSFDIRVTADAMQIDPVIVAPLLAIPILLILIIGVLSHNRKRK